MRHAHSDRSLADMREPAVGVGETTRSDWTCMPATRVRVARRLDCQPLKGWRSGHRDSHRSVLFLLGGGRVPRVFWGETTRQGHASARREAALILMGDWCVLINHQD